MAKKPKRHGGSGPAPFDLQGRIHKAEAEGRWQQALELAKALFKQDPSPPHRELIKRTTLGRVGQLRSQGHYRDAATALENAVGLDAEPGWRDRIAGEMASCGEVRKALDLVLPFPDSPALPRIWALAADWSMSQGKADRTLLPEEMLGQYDLIHRAFVQVEAGQDEEAKATLQGIGLRSPFLDWKMLARGLVAYYQGDSPRALENWGRLDPERLPARLAAPFRFTIDPAYRQAQSPATQASLQQQADRLQDSGFVKPLRDLRAALANENKLPQAFRLAENLLPALHKENPQLVPRLATCFYWAIIAHGQPEDMNRYERVFGKPPDDPHFSRLQAMTFEHGASLTQAHKFWQEYEKAIADGTVTWPGQHSAQARALIWSHMGLNAAKALDENDPEDFPSFLGEGPRQPLKPSAEKCFERSLELAPDLQGTYQNLIGFWISKKKPAEAIKVARRMLERYPDHVPTLEALGDLLQDQKKHSEALAIFQRALHNNPLDRRLRSKIGTSHGHAARQHVEAGEFDEARRHYQSALSLKEGQADPALLCKWAACEFKAGNADQAETLIQRARAEGAPLGAAFTMLIEIIRAKLPRPLKNRFDKEFKTALGEPPSPAAAVGVAQTAAIHKLAKVDYTGQKAHEKKIIAYLEKAITLDFTEDQLEEVGQALISLNAPKVGLSYFRRGQKKFPASPFFFLLEAEQVLGKGVRRGTFEAQKLLDKAQKLTDALPLGDKKKEFLERIQDHQEKLQAFNPFGRMPQFRMFQDIFGDMIDDDEDDFLDDDFF